MYGGEGSGADGAVDAVQTLERRILGRLILSLRNGEPKLNPKLSPCPLRAVQSMHPSRHPAALGGGEPKRTAAGQIEQKIHWALHSEAA